jgi:mRNA-degrading endonuclease RelE of RelBE toxin-antitoxin system
MKKPTLSCRIEPEARLILERLAKQEKRTLSDYVNTVLIDHIKRRGIDLGKYRKSRQLNLF